MKCVLSVVCVEFLQSSLISSTYVCVQFFQDVESFVVLQNSNSKSKCCFSSSMLCTRSGLCACTGVA